MKLGCGELAANLVCETHDCARCGFNKEEANFRKEYVRKYGLTRTADGKQQLCVTPNKRKNLELKLWRDEYEKEEV